MSQPRVIADTPDISEGNPVIWQAPDGLVWLFYVNRYGDTPVNLRVKIKISEMGPHRSDSFMLTFEQALWCGTAIVLNDGDYLLPLCITKPVRIPR